MVVRDWKVHWMFMKPLGQIKLRVVDADPTPAPFLSSPTEQEEQLITMEQLPSFFFPLRSARVKLRGQVVWRESTFRKRHQRTFLMLSDGDDSTMPAYAFFTPESFHPVVYVTFSAEDCEVGWQAVRTSCLCGDVVEIVGHPEVSPRGMARLAGISFTVLKKANHDWFQPIPLILPVQPRLFPLPSKTSQSLASLAKSLTTCPVDSSVVSEELPVRIVLQHEKEGDTNHIDVSSEGTSRTHGSDSSVPTQGHPDSSTQEELENNVQTLIRECRESTSPYLVRFAQLSVAQQFLELSEKFPSFAELFRHQNLSKEISETFAALSLVDTALDWRSHSPPPPGIHKTVESCEFAGGGVEGENLLFFDICSGKGFTSILLALLFPRAQIVMVDWNEFMDTSHIDLLPNIKYHSFDIMQPEFQDFVEATCRNSGKLAIAIGLHLCGWLSPRLAEIFNMLTNLAVVVISPCCFPSAHNSHAKPHKHTKDNVSQRKPKPQSLEQKNPLKESALSRTVNKVDSGRDTSVGIQGSQAQADEKTQDMHVMNNLSREQLLEQNSKITQQRLADQMAFFGEKVYMDDTERYMRWCLQVHAGLAAGNSWRGCFGGKDVGVDKAMLSPKSIIMWGCRSVVCPGLAAS